MQRFFRQELHNAHYRAQMVSEATAASDRSDSWRTGGSGQAEWRRIAGSSRPSQTVRPMADHSQSHSADAVPEPETRRHRWWRSVWVLLTLLPLGLGSWAAFLYAGDAAGVRRWRIWGAVYLAVTQVWILLLMAGTAGGPVAVVGLLLGTVAWIGSIVHALRIRADFLRLTSGDPRADIAGDGNDEVRIYVSRPKGIAVMLLCGDLAILVTGAAITDPVSRTSIGTWAALVVIVVAAVGAYFVWSGHTPGLVVGRRGLGQTGQDIPWEDVTRVGHYEQRVQGSTLDYLTVFTSGEPKTQTPTNVVTETIAHIERSMTGGASRTIPIDMLTISAANALKLVRRFYDGPVDDA